MKDNKISRTQLMALLWAGVMAPAAELLPALLSPSTIPAVTSSAVRKSCPARAKAGSVPRPIHSRTPATASRKNHIAPSVVLALSLFQAKLERLEQAQDRMSAMPQR